MNINIVLRKQTKLSTTLSSKVSRFDLLRPEYIVHIVLYSTFILVLCTTLLRVSLFTLVNHRISFRFFPNPISHSTIGLFLYLHIQHPSSWNYLLIAVFAYHIFISCSSLHIFVSSYFSSNPKNSYFDHWCKRYRVALRINSRNSAFH